MKLFISFLFVLLTVTLLEAQVTISSGRLSITVENIGNGAKVTHIRDNGTETLNTSTLSQFFTIYIRNTTNNIDYEISSASGWANVNITSTGSSCTIDFDTPTDAGLPNTLSATVTINTNDARSDWDLSISGIGANHSLMDVVFPKLNIKADGNDTFLYPLYSGRLTSNPGSGIDYYDDPADNGDNIVGLYPRGGGTTMQFMSYYNNNYGLYFGYHDPDASIKYFGVKNENSGVKIECKYPIPDKTVAGNNWDLPGVFELDLYDGNWYEAAKIYKAWVSTNSNYWPQDSPERNTRQQVIGDIGIWLTTSDFSSISMSNMETYIQQAINFFDVPVGVHAYNWNYKEFDHFYPDYFPERDGFPSLVANIQNNNDAVIMPYTNGRLWDTGEGGNDSGDSAAAVWYNNEGKPDATKQSDSTEYTQTFKNNIFAVMCPKQTDWQNRLVSIEDTITNSTEIGAKAIYMDQVAAANPVQCMDSTHNHKLGGGAYWKNGYEEMIDSIHSTIPDDVFVTTEGGCDFIAGQIDAFMVQSWTTDHQIPAWQAVYTGKVQLFGTKTGGSQYGNQQFYAKLGQGYIYGVQTGRQYIWLAINPDANPDKSMASHFVKRLSRMRYKLRDFMSYGEMKKPLELTGEIPDLTYHVFDWGGHKGYVDVNYPAVQNSVWQHGDSVAVSLINASLPDVPNVIDDSINISFSFDGSEYGLSGTLAVTEITETGEGKPFFTENSFTLTTDIPSITPKAYLIRPASDLGNVYYVSTTGNDANSGTSESQAWRTVTYAASNASPVQAGDIVYIKAGDYGNENVNFEISGTNDLPILFAGYQNTPGDSPNTNHSFGDTLDASVMPLFNGGDRATAGGAFQFVYINNITLKNIQITNYNYGIYGYGSSNLPFDNIILTELGDVTGNYDGTGFSLSENDDGDFGEYNTVKNCFVENAAAEGYSIAGDYNNVLNCKVYCNENTGNAAMDYYITITGNHNLVNDCYAERIGTLDHNGHGIEFKEDSEYNTVKNSIAKNLGSGFGVRHRGCKYNTFENCKSYDFYGFEVRDGASNNVFKNCEAINNESSILFYDTDEDGDAQYTGRHNVFENCIFRNTTENVIDFFYYSLESVCDSNTFKNCVIDGGDYLFNCDRSNHDNKLVNCIVTNVNNYYRTAYHQANSYPLNVIWENSDFYSNGFTAPAGTSITTFDPQFIDIANHDYHLQSTSQCIDAGNTAESPESDKDGVYRPLLKQADLGAYEYGIYWTGYKGNYWRNAANWSNNQIPTSADNVTIPSPKYYYNRPEVNDDSQVKSLYLHDGGKILIKNNAIFDVD